MKTPDHYRWVRGVAIAIACFMLLLLGVKLPGTNAETTKPELSPREQFRLGEKMYREGILPSGETMQAIVKGDVTVLGTSFTCVSCHLHAGLGSFEGGVITPPTNGAKLFKVLQVYSSPTRSDKPFKPTQIVEQNLKYNQTNVVRRPVYTDESLAVSLRDGMDSAGRIMDDVMPRYPLEPGDMALLVSYLKSLSSEYSPGVTDTEIRFATIITDDVTPEEQNMMLIPLENFIKAKNQKNVFDPGQTLRSRSSGFRSRVMAETTFAPKGGAIHTLTLSLWMLKGAPETWRRQLEEYNRKEPVFAILGGISHGDWLPIHQFCEENQIPNLFPITDYPVISQTDWYTLYFSKGFYQEGEAAARFLNDKDEVQRKPVLQIVRDSPEGRALSRGFGETWCDFGQTAPDTVILKAGEVLTSELLQRKTAQGKPAAILLWDGPETLKELKMMAQEQNRPDMVLVSSSLLGKGMFSMDDRIRGFTYLTYPYGISQTPQEKSATSMGIKKFNAEANCVPMIRISQQTYILTVILDMALLDMKDNYYRDNLLDVIGMVMDQDVPLYERLSFGPGQRYASKGCYIVQVGKPGLVKKSSWVTH